MAGRKTCVRYDPGSAFYRSRQHGYERAAILVVAGSTHAVAGVGPVAAQSVGSNPPEETEDGATFTVSTQSIELHEGGTICARKLAPDVNEVTITDATMNGVELYLGNEEEAKKVTSPSAEVDEIVLYTNGENQLVNLLATTGACITLDQPQQTVLEVCYQEAGTLQMEQFQFVTGGTNSPPEPGGFTVPASLLNNSSSSGGPVANATATVNGTVGDATGTVGRVTDAITPTPSSAIDRADETAGNVTEVVDRVGNPTGTVNDTLETVDGTTGTVTETVDGTTKTVNGMVSNTTGTVTDTVDDTTETVNETVEDDTGTVDRTTKTVDDTTDVVENTTGEVGDTVDETTGDTVTAVEESTDDTQTAVEGTTTGVQTTAEEVVPPTAGFGLPADVPLVGDPITLDASRSSDSDGSIETYEWDFDGDGSYEKSGRQVTHSFSSGGGKEATLRVTDDDGATDTVTRTVPVNAPPTAAFSVLSELLTIGEPISLDATGSSDPDGSIATYEWDLDGDGSFEGTGPSPTFDSLGTREITLRVTDDQGATDTVTKSIDLTESDDGGLLGGDSTTTESGTDSGGSTTDDGGSIVGAILP